MKRYGNLFEGAFSEDNLYLAYLDARKGKRGRRACFEFERHLGANLAGLRAAIHAGTYRPRPYFEFIVYEPKRRVIHAPAFCDVVVQHAIYRVIYGLFDRSFLRNSFACRLGYGTHRAADYAQAAMRRHDGEAYYLKLDVRKFFYSIPRPLLRRLIERKIKDRRLVDMMMLFAEMDAERGIPIGNLLSQIFALIVLNPVDHFIKRVLKVRDYVRYVDDLVLIGLSRPACLALWETIRRFLGEALSLDLSKTTIAKIRRGLNFCGYRMWRTRSFIRKHSLYKFRRALAHGAQDSINSLLGHARRTLSLVSMLKAIKEENDHGKDIQVPEGYRRLYDALAYGAGLPAPGAG